nr:uncharacterized protein LOC108085309 [Drosophila kikkawai]
MSRKILALHLLVFLYVVIKVSCKIEFTNIECKSTDKNFADFEYCYLKSVNRSYKYLTLKLNMLLLKRFNGYRPFMYNVTVDMCRFMINPEVNPIANYFYELFKTYSNLNQSCPFSEDVIVDKLTATFVNNKFTNVLPFPEGDYCFESHWIAYEVERAVVKVFGTLTP